jgi:hypothetical protein
VAQDGQGTEWTSEYWYIKRLIKYMKAGKETATILWPCWLKDHDLPSFKPECYEKYRRS